MTEPEQKAANSFRADEIDALVEILALVRRGAHTRDLSRAVTPDVLGRVAGKVQRMKASVERQKELGMRLVEGGKR